MERMKVYDEELALMFGGAAAEMGSFPPHLAEYGRGILERMNPLRGAAKTNSLFGLLPFWLRERWDIPLEVCRDLAVGNIFLTLHFVLLDDAMDKAMAPGSDGARVALSFGQLCQEAFRRRYVRQGADDSLFWEKYRGYVCDWAAYVSREGQGMRSDPRDPGLLASKAAPLKVCAAAVLLAAGCEEELPALEEAVDLALAVLQLADDWADWKDDLAEESGSAFLVLVREKLSKPEGEALTEREVKRAIYHFDAVGLLGEIAEGYAERMRGNVSAPDSLTAFAADLAAAIRRDARLAAETTDRLANGGGWSYFLSNFS
jgi:hypothetical protein